MEEKENNTIYKVALLVSLSCVLQIAESLIPHPFPGIRLGLANIMTLIAMDNLGFACALEVAILRTVLSSFISGTFMSPTFILSFSGALASTVIMGLFYWLSCLHRRYRLSIVGISILGALTHNIVQLYLAYFILIRHPGIFVFFPWLCIGAVLMGWLTGMVAGEVCLKLKENTLSLAAHDYSGISGTTSAFNFYLPGDSFIHRIPAEVKISGVFFFSLAVLIFDNRWFYLGAFMLLSVLLISSRADLPGLFSRTKKCSLLVLTAFLLPVFFNSGFPGASPAAYFHFTSQGVHQGAVFAARIIFLILANSLLMHTTSPRDLTAALKKILAPLRKAGICEKRTAEILSLSLSALPFCWEAAKSGIRAADFKKAGNARNLIPALSDFIAQFYLGSQEMSVFWESKNQAVKVQHGQP